MPATTSAYDQVAYPSYPFPAAHPDRIAIVAHLAGLDVTDVTSCRVLELGCGAGGNILPLADTLPGSQFVGVDMSSQQIAQARQIRDAIGIENLELLVCDILTLDASLGEFDSILFHGVFSWTTDDVRQKILSICADHLTPRGVALINYNTYPGWHLQNWVRDMIRTRALTFHEPVAQIREARAMLDFFIAAFRSQSLPHQRLLLSELEQVQGFSDEFLFHAILNFQNQPFYLHEFVERCATQSLCYLGDAEPILSWRGSMPEEIVAGLEHLCRSHLAIEQHLDFINNTTSRRSVLCRQSAARHCEQRNQRLHATYVSAPLKQSASAGEPDVAAFRTPAGRTISTRNPGLRAALIAIAEAWPESIPYATLTSDTLHPPETWEAELLNCYAAGILEFRLRTLPCSRTPSTRPVATQLARWQAVHQPFVTNLRHQAIRLSPADCQLLQYLDGTSTIAELAARTSVDTSHVAVQIDGLQQQSLLPSGGTNISSN